MLLEELLKIKSKSASTKAKAREVHHAKAGRLTLLLAVCLLRRSVELLLPSFGDLANLSAALQDPRIRSLSCSGVSQGFQLACLRSSGEKQKGESGTRPGYRL